MARAKRPLARCTPCGRRRSSGWDEEADSTVLVQLGTADDDTGKVSVIFTLDASSNMTSIDYVKIGNWGFTAGKAKAAEIAEAE